MAILRQSETGCDGTHAQQLMVQQPDLLVHLQVRSELRDAGRQAGNLHSGGASVVGAALELSDLGKVGALATVPCAAGASGSTVRSSA